MPTTRLAAATTIFACTISGGLLTLPAIFSSTSLSVSLCLVIFSAVTTFSSLVALVALGEMHNVDGYGTLVGQVFGPTSKQLMNLVIGIFLVGVIGGSFIVVHDYMKAEFQQVANLDYAPELATAVIGGIVLLLALPHKMSALSLAASFSMLSFLFLVGTLMYYGTAALVWPPPSSNATLPVPWWPSDSQTIGDTVAAIGTAVPVILYAFGCQIQIFDIYDSVGQKRTPRGIHHFVPVMAAAVLLMVVLFSLVGVFGYFAFRGTHIHGDVLKNLQSKGTLGNVARGMLVLACILAAPLIVHPTQVCLGASIEALVLPRPLRSFTFGRLMLTFGIVGSAVGLALSGIKFLVVVGALGAFICSPLFFILPGGMLWHGLRKEGGSGGTLEVQQLDVTLLGTEGGRQAEKCVLSARERCAMMGVAVWLVVMGTLTFAISVWKFLTPGS